LQQCQVWQNLINEGKADKECKVKILEIDGAPHREILADKRFQMALLDYVVGEAQLHAYEEEAAKTLQNAFHMRLKNVIVSSISRKT